MGMLMGVPAVFAGGFGAGGATGAECAGDAAGRALPESGLT